jgi:hypothetical protein
MAMIHTPVLARIQIIVMAKGIEGDGLDAPQNPLTFFLWSVRFPLFTRLTEPPLVTNMIIYTEKPGKQEKRIKAPQHFLSPKESHD